MENNCKTCEYNFPDGNGKRVCSIGTNYGKLISKILKTNKTCDDYKLKFNLYVKNTKLNNIM